MPNYHYKAGVTLSEQELADLMARYTLKFAWFYQRGYKPHYWQTLFHCSTDSTTDNLCRFRHLVAGRRGGKTLSAAWESLYYVLNPQAFHMDAHGVNSKEPLHAWFLAKDYPTGMAALLAFRKVLEDAGYEHGREYKENRGNRWFEFENGSFVQFKTADDPETLRGAGLDLLWIDEAAFIRDKRAWEVVRPAISDKIGLAITTTTPDGKNWYYDEFWKPDSMSDPATSRVEYRSIDNPHFSSEEWKYLMRTYHPMKFKQEFMASFDSMAGRELSGEWLKYYSLDEILIDTKKPLTPNNVDLKVYMGVDPAISLADSADRFVITVLGVKHDRSQAYLLEQFAAQIPFPEQVDKINELFIKWSPQYIGIEKTAYQAALVQQVSRLSGFPPVVPHFTKGKKFERILAMSPLFRIGKVKILPEHIDFIDEWLDYDSTRPNPKDDCLDSMDITLRTAGVLLPGMVQASNSFLAQEDNSLEALRARDLPTTPSTGQGFDEHLGADW